MLLWLDSKGKAQEVNPIKERAQPKVWLQMECQTNQ